MFPELGDPPTWTEESLAQLNARDIEYNGKTYTQYEISQMQRARERNVRRWKKRYLAEDAAGVDTTSSAVRLRAARQRLAEFAQATGGRVDSARTSVPKFGRSEGSKAAWAAKKKYFTYNSLNTEPQPVTMQSIANVKAFDCETLDVTGQQQLKNAHKRLLVTALKRNENVEVGIVFDTHMKILAKGLVGPSDGGSIDLPDQNVPYVAVHTHPDCSIISHGDLENFTERENLKLLTAIGHDGHVYAIEKSPSYDSVTAKAISWKLNAEINRLINLPQAELPNKQLLEQADALIRQAMADLEQHGVKFYE